MVAIVAGCGGDRVAAVPAGVTRVSVPTHPPPGMTPAPTKRLPPTPQPAPPGWEHRFCELKRVVGNLQDIYNDFGPIKSRADLAKWRRIATRLIDDSQLATAKLRALPDWPVAKPLLTVYARLAARSAALGIVVREFTTHISSGGNYIAEIKRTEKAFGQAIWDTAFAEEDYGARLHTSCPTV